MNWNFKHNISTAIFYPLATLTVTINLSSDVTSGAVGYVAKWGNDLTGNGSRQYPYLTVQKALDSSKTTIVIGAGVYTEPVNWPNGGLRHFIADTPNSVVFDGTGIAVFGNTFVASTHFYGLQVKNYGNTGSSVNSGFCFYHCHLENMSRAVVFSSSGSQHRLIGCTLKDMPGTNVLAINQTPDQASYNTFFNCGVSIAGVFSTGLYAHYNIFSNCRISLSEVRVDYVLFHNCTFSFNGGATYTAYNSIEALRAAYQTAFPNNTLNFPNSRIADPKFNNPAKGDFTLAFDSPAKNMGYDGRWIGAKGIAKSQAPATAIYTENVTITDNVATLTNTALPGVIRFPIQDLGAEYELGVLDFAGLMGLRNGEAIDATKDTADTTLSAGAALTSNAAYVVETGSINYNGTMYQIGSRFVAVAAATTFSSTEGGVVRLIAEKPNGYTVKMKTHRSIGDPATFDALPWHLYTMGRKVTANRAGDLGTGAILKGNGAPDYDATPAKVLPVFAQYYQVEIIISVGTLKS